ncbi:MAG: hypothetical protein IT359_05755 [Gemmatimonadaceae bacterium]|nr:hypothetical protein [Gemmatimonadaceae bacterium]
MRIRLVRLLVPVSLFVVACGRDTSRTTGMSEDLKKDLEASTSKFELAGADNARPMAYVSELEQVNGAAPVERTPQRRRVATRSANVQLPEEKSSPAPQVADEVQLAQAPEETAPVPAPADEAPRVPTVAPRPSALPVDVPGGGSGGGYGNGGIGGRGDGRGEGIGDIIGIVIRGGGVGVDHCPPRRRGRPRIPVNW